MEELHKKWEKIHHCLQALEAADQEQEAEILKKAYECLLCAYQESRALNDELKLVYNTLIYNRTSQVLFENNRTGRKSNTHNYIAGAHVCARRR